MTAERAPRRVSAAFALAALILVGLAALQQAARLELEAAEEEGGREGPGVEGAKAAELAALQREGRELRARLTASGPRGAYIVVDRGNNRIYLRTKDSVEVAAPASTGSHAILKETTGEQRSWVFETPPGQFRILRERVDPVWTRPDWAYLETGEPIPTKVSDRREYGSLGEYALDLGDGYMIHGTLYERLLGRSVTHGCVRVGREALRAIAARTSAGSRVFIF